MIAILPNCSSSFRVSECIRQCKRSFATNSFVYYFFHKLISFVPLVIHPSRVQAISNCTRIRSYVPHRMYKTKWYINSLVNVILREKSSINTVTRRKPPKKIPCFRVLFVDSFHCTYTCASSSFLSVCTKVQCDAYTVYTKM